MITRLEAVHVLKEMEDCDIRIPHADKAKDAIQEAILSLNHSGGKWIHIRTFMHMTSKCDCCGCLVKDTAVDFGELRFCPNCGQYNNSYCSFGIQYPVETNAWTKQEPWIELKETIEELRDNGGTATQKEVCTFLVSLMEVLENGKTED